MTRYPVPWWVEVLKKKYTEDGDERALPLAERIIEGESKKPYLNLYGGDVPTWLSEHVYENLHFLSRDPELVRLEK